ncbi:MAG: response regulator [Candidatus Heimdallarchaeota archaeon]
MKPRILFVDDETSLLNAITGMFQFQDDYVVHVAESGEQALQMMRTSPDYHVIVTDQLMPGMTGEKLLEQVQVEFPGTIRLILTAYGTLDLAQKAVNELGVFGFLQKPIKRSDLFPILEKAVERYQENKRIEQLLSKYEQSIPPSEILKNLWIIAANHAPPNRPEVIATHPNVLPGVDVHRLAYQAFLSSVAVSSAFGQSGMGDSIQITLPVHYLKMEAKFHFDALKTRENGSQMKFAIILLAPTIQASLDTAASSCMSDFALNYRNNQEIDLNSLFQCISNNFAETD